MIKSLIKKTAAIPGMDKLARYLTRYKPAILMYHGLTENPDIRDWSQINADDFKVQMQYLKKYCRPVSLKKLTGMLESGQVEPDAVVVTFDDGYKSNYDLAYPILKQLEIPATIFVASKFVLSRKNTPQYLWPDFISILLKSYSGDTLDLEDIGLGQYDLTSLRNTIRARDEICEHLKSIATEGKDNIVSTLNARYGGIIDHDRFTDYSPMSPDEVRRLANEGLISIGAHSRSHPILSQLDAPCLADEIYGSKKDLEEITGVTITEFAYPNGRWQDINREVVELTARHFDCAVMTEPGLNLPGQNKYLLRRIGIGRNLNKRQFQIMSSGIYYLAQKPARQYEESRNR